MPGHAVNPQPLEIQKRGDEEILIRWEDGHESVYSFSYLRRLCPCAECVDEWSGRTTLDPASVPENLKAEKAELIGNYAIAFQFSDGHSTGIFSFEKLRRFCACSRCRTP